jgi:hypothetical protein
MRIFERIFPHRVSLSSLAGLGRAVARLIEVPRERDCLVSRQGRCPPEAPCADCAWAQGTSRDGT